MEIRQIFKIKTARYKQRQNYRTQATISIRENGCCLACRHEGHGKCNTAGEEEFLNVHPKYCDFVIEDEDICDRFKPIDQLWSPGKGINNIRYWVNKNGAHTLRRLKQEIKEEESRMMMSMMMGGFPGFYSNLFKIARQSGRTNDPPLFIGEEPMLEQEYVDDQKTDNT